MKNKNKAILGVVTTGFIWLLSGTSCEKTEITRSMEEDNETERIDDKSGISLDMESDSLYEDIEEIHFNAEEWGEEGMDVDL